MDNKTPRARAIAACVTSLKLLKSRCPSSGPLHLPEFAELSTADFKTKTATGSIALETAVERFIDSITHEKNAKNDIDSFPAGVTGQAMLELVNKQIPVLNPCGVACAGIVALGDAAYTQANRLEDIEDVLHQVSAILHRIVRRLSLITVEIDSQDPTAEDLHCAALFCCADIIGFIAFAIGERKANVLKRFANTIVHPNHFTKAKERILNSEERYQYCLLDHIAYEVSSLRKAHDLSIDLRMDRKLQDEHTKSDAEENMISSNRSFHAPSAEEFDKFIHEVQNCPSPPEWIFNESRIQNILFEPTESKKILWLHGPAGIGKSCVAAFLIHTLRETYRSNVAYYFFSMARKMTSARHAIHAIQYQLERQFGRASFHIPSHTEPGIETLTRNYICPYLKKGPIYLVIDGVDEADLKRKDPVHRSKSEIEIFLTTLAELPIRIILVSRPMSTIPKFLPQRYSRGLKAENTRVVDSIVTQFLSRNPHLETMFHKEGLVPIDFFHRNSNGVIRWVQSALNELGSFRSQKEFRSCITRLPEDHTHLHDDYSGTLSNLTKEDRNILREILLRLETCGSESIIRLQSYLEWSLEVNFNRWEAIGTEKGNGLTEFLKVNFGSFLEINLVGSVFQYEVLSFCHPSIRTFLGPDYFQEADFNRRTFYTRFILKYFRSLLDPTRWNPTAFVGPHILAEYLQKTFWTGADATQILVYIYRFLTNPRALNLWLLNALDDDCLKDITSYDILKNGISAIDKFLHSAQQWLERYKTDIVDQGTDADDSEDGPLAKALMARQMLVKDASLLQTHIGKFAARQAFYAVFPDNYGGSQIERSFAFGAHQYWQVKGKHCREKTILEHLQNNFASLVAWVSMGEPRPANMGCIRSFLHQWDLSVSSYKKALEADLNDYDLWIWLGVAYEAQGNPVEAAGSYMSAVKAGYGFHHGCRMAASAFRRTNDLEGFHKFAKEVALDTHVDATLMDNQQVSTMHVYMTAGDFRSAVRSWNNPDDVDHLVECYEAIDYDQAIPSLNDLVRFNSTCGFFQVPLGWLNIALAKACLANSQYTETIAAATNALGYPNSEHAYLILFDAFIAMGDDTKFIELIERMVIEIPVFAPLWEKLFQRFLSIKEHAEVKAYFDRMCNIRILRDSSIWFECFYEGSQACGLAYEREGMSGNAIKVYEAALATDTMFENIWSLLCCRYGVTERAKAAEIARSLVQALQQDRRTDNSMAKSFREDFLALHDKSESVHRFACWYGLVIVLELVGDKGALTRDSRGWTAVHVVAHQGHEGALEHILKHNKGHLQLVDKEGRSALHLAAIKDRTEVVRRLLVWRSNVNARCSIGATPLDYAIEHGNWEVAAILRS